MTPSRLLLLGLAATALLRLAAPAGAAEPPAGMVRIPEGEFAPVVRMKDEPEKVPVASFWLQERAVTNAEFLAFVQDNPKWRRSLSLSM